MGLQDELEAPARGFDPWPELSRCALAKPEAGKADGAAPQARHRRQPADAIAKAALQVSVEPLLLVGGEPGRDVRFSRGLGSVTDDHLFEIESEHVAASSSFRSSIITTNA
jgi:hypothetical protein